MRRIAPLALTLAALPLAALAEDRAVVVGIDAYPGVSLPRPIGHAASDAARMARHLTEDRGFASANVTVLTNEAATSDAIINALFDELVMGTRPGDRAIFYFAGLGGRIADPSSGDADQYEEFLLAHGDDDPFALIPENAFTEIFDQITDREVTVIIDASMTAPQPGRMQGEGAAPRAAQFGQLSGVPTRQAIPSGGLPQIGDSTFSENPFTGGVDIRDVWSAAGPSQVAWEDPQQGGGVFTDSYIEGVGDGLADMNGNGAVSNAELLVYLREQSQQWCADTDTCTAEGLGLTPNFSGDVLGIAAEIGGVEIPDAAREALEAASSSAAPVIEPVIIPPSTDAPEEPEAPAETTEIAPVFIPPALPETPQEAAQVGEVEAFVTDLFAASNTAGLTLAMAPNSTLRLGDLVSFEVGSRRSGTLLLLDINPDGEIFQIFPSRLSVADADSLTAGIPLTIPEAVANTGRALQIRVTEPVGDGILLALLVEGDVPVYDQLLPQNLNLEPIPNANQFLYEIVQSLLELQVGPDGNVAVDWSAAYLPYRIEP